MNVGEEYTELPLHCTLMHRFWCDLDDKALADKVRGFFDKTSPIVLDACEQLLLGPKQVIVSGINLSKALKDLHMQLYQILNDLGVEYTAPEWVAEGYRAHATERGDDKPEVGTQHVSNAVYLIEVKVPGYDHKRLVRARFILK